MHFKAAHSFFQQNVAVLQQAWEQGWTWEVTKTIYCKILVTMLAIIYAIALIIEIVYNQLMAFFTQGVLHKIRKEVFTHICKTANSFILIHIRMVISCLTIQMISMQCVR